MTPLRGIESHCGTGEQRRRGQSDDLFQVGNEFRERIVRSLQDLITIVGDLRRRSVGFRSLHETLDTTTPGGRLVFHVFAALAEFIRELIVEGTHEGLATAHARGALSPRE